MVALEIWQGSRGLEDLTALARTITGGLRVSISTVVRGGVQAGAVAVWRRLTAGSIQGLGAGGLATCMGWEQGGWPHAGSGSRGAGHMQGRSQEHESGAGGGAGAGGGVWLPSR